MSLQKFIGKRDLSYCSICGNLTDQDPCAISRTQRETNLLF